MRLFTSAKATFVWYSAGPGTLIGHWHIKFKLGGRTKNKNEYEYTTLYYRLLKHVIVLLFQP